MGKTMKEFTKYEKARIIGARALQISMDAPILLKLDKEEMEKTNFDSLRIAQKELEEGVLPISINRPLPERKESKLKKVIKDNSDSPEKSLEEEDEIVQELEQNFESEDDEESDSSEQE